MDLRRDEPRRPKRAIATAALLGWIAILALAGWPTEVRPRLLDGAHDASVRFLRLFGMSAGQPLFQTDANPWKQHGYCLYVRATPAPADGSLLFPPGGRCRIYGFHPRLPPVSRATHRMLSSGWELANVGQVEEAAPFPRAIGRAFCLESDTGDAAPDGVDAAWIWYYKHYDDGRVMRRNGLVFAYSCAEQDLTSIEWNPDDASVRAFWGGDAW
jgi:hypothetical protein